MSPGGSRFRALVLVLAGLLFLFSCTAPRYRTAPATGSVYGSLKMKVRVTDTLSGKKQSFKAVIKYDRGRARVLLIAPPINQVYGRVLVEGESALLINAKKKKYWQGEFRDLLDELWAIDLDYREFEKLIDGGIIPQERLAERCLHVSVQLAEEGGKPAVIDVVSGDISIRLQIYDRKTQAGSFTLEENLSRLEKSSLRDVLTDS
jgi:hypothetical protein